MNYAVIKNNQRLALADLPVLDYAVFYDVVLHLLSDPLNHCVAYYGFPVGENGETLKFICCIAKDNKSEIVVLSYELETEGKHILDALGDDMFAMQQYEREITENFGVEFFGHPWPKPLRYAHNRFDKEQVLQNYPFFKINSPQLHEVGVGPIHAGVIEPGHFRFICNGETVLHLEIQLGYQHRGVESLFLTKKTLLQRTLLAENIAGDSTIAHTLAFAGCMESLGDVQVHEQIHLLRTLALELERIAIHVGDMSAFCLDVAHQLGSAVYGALRTPIINYTQLWCGNRFGKSLIRAGYNPWPYTRELRDKLTAILTDFEFKYREMEENMFSLPSVQARFDSTGTVTREQMQLIGAVGMVARTVGIQKDIRRSHPFAYYKFLSYQPVFQETGDVWARGMLRNLEILQSIDYVRKLIQRLDLTYTEEEQQRTQNITLQPDSFTISMIESWRGETVHCAVTDGAGKLKHYKVKDASFHNWLALALSVRNNEISDFPICNKSYDLSYCGHDL